MYARNTDVGRQPRPRINRRSCRDVVEQYRPERQHRPLLLLRPDWSAMRMPWMGARSATYAVIGKRYLLSACNAFLRSCGVVCSMRCAVCSTCWRFCLRRGMTCLCPSTSAFAISVR